MMREWMSECIEKHGSSNLTEDCFPRPLRLLKLSGASDDSDPCHDLRLVEYLST
jgi:hypothetical protein